MTEFADENPEESAESLENGEAGTGEVSTPQASGSHGPLRRAFDGSARGPSVDQIRADYGVETPYALIIRGFIRVSTGDGVPPAAEIFLGIVLAVLAQGSDETAAESPNEEADEETPEIGEFEAE